jgi:hypothetical protein
MLKQMNQRRKRGQSTLEYAILMVIIIGALLSIQVYIKRGIQGRMKQVTDDIGDQHSDGNQFYNKTVISTSGTFDTFQDGVQRTELRTGDSTTTLVNSFIQNSEREFWGSQEDTE